MLFIQNAEYATLDNVYRTLRREKGLRPDQIETGEPRGNRVFTAKDMAEKGYIGLYRKQEQK